MVYPLRKPPAEGKTMDKPTVPVTVKAMPVAEWKRAKDAAEKQDQSMAEWLARAINQLADREAGEREVFPNQAPVSPPSLPTPTIPAGEVTEMMRAAHAVSQAAGVPVPKTVARHLFAVLSAQARAARGLPASKPRSPRGETVRRIEAEGTTTP